MIKLSIAIPTYARKQMLLKTLESIKPQLCCGVEIVVSDNGSQDGTYEMLSKLNMPLRITGFCENQGIDANIVNVIQQAQGAYVLLFSDDDLFMEGFLEKLLAVLENPYDVVVLNHFAFTQDPHKPLTPCFLPKKDEEFFDQEKFFRYVGLGFLSSLVFKKELAIPYFSKVRFGKECAHVDIVARIVLDPKTRCYFAGSLSVAARSLEVPRYAMMNSCVIFLHELYQELAQEKKLSLCSYLYFHYKLVFKEVPRIYYKLLLQDPIKAKLAAQDVLKYFQDPLSKSFIFALKLIPAALSLGIFKLLHRIVQRKRLKKF